MAKATTKKATAPKADLLDREPTAMHTSYADWITEQTGYEVDAKSIQLGTLLRGEYQKSDVNQALMASRAEERAAEAEAREQKKEEREAAKEEKAAKAAEKKAAAKEAKSAEKPAAKKAAPAKKAPAAKKAPSGSKRRPVAKK